MASVPKPARALESFVPLILAVAVGLYLLAAIGTAATRPLWSDELFTAYLNRLPSVRDLWRALLTEVDQMPIGFYLITRLFTRPSVNSEVLVRMPATFGFLLCGVGLYLFVRRRLPAAYAAMAALFPLLTVAGGYTIEARAYGLVLGFGALALVCWQAAADGRNRVLALLGLSLSLALAISCHYYAVLLLVPLAVGEIARRKWDPAVWLALVSSLLVFIPLWPFVQAARTLSTHFWSKPSLQQIPNFYLYLLFPGLLSFLVMGVATLILCLKRGKKSSWPVPPHEMVATVTLLSVPVVAVVLGVLVTGAYTERYALVTVLGVALFFAYGMAYLLHVKPRLGTKLLLIMLICAAASFGLQFQRALQKKADMAERGRQIVAATSADPSRPIVVSHGSTYLELLYHGPGQLRSRLFYVHDVQRALARVRTDSVERTFWALRCCADIQIQDYAPFLQHHAKFWVYEADEQKFQWVLPELTADGALVGPAQAIPASHGRIHSVELSLSARQRGNTWQLKP